MGYKHIQSNQILLVVHKCYYCSSYILEVRSINPLALELDMEIVYIYVKSEYFTNQKRQRYEIHDIL